MILINKQNNEGGTMMERNENNISSRLQILEKRIKELEKAIKKEKEQLLDKYLKAQGFK